MKLPKNKFPFLCVYMCGCVSFCAHMHVGSCEADKGIGSSETRITDDCKCHVDAGIESLEKQPVFLIPEAPKVIFFN